MAIFLGHCLKGLNYRVDRPVRRTEFRAREPNVFASPEPRTEKRARRLDDHVTQDQAQAGLAWRVITTNFWDSDGARVPDYGANALRSCRRAGTPGLSRTRTADRQAYSDAHTHLLVKGVFAV